jgi:hypothetical protein
MKQSFLFLFLLLQLTSFGQRSGRRSLSSSAANRHYEGPKFNGPFFEVKLINGDTIPFLLRLGLSKRIVNKDTLSLARIYSCNKPVTSVYYDLDNPASEILSCVSWYSFQLINPKDTFHFTISLNHYEETDAGRLYYCYSKKVTKQDENHALHSDPKTIYITKDARDFDTNYIVLSTDKPNVILLHCGQ